MESNSELVEYLVDQSYIETDAVEEAFRAVDRKKFVPDRHKGKAYIDRPIQIGENATISAPHMVAINTELLAPEGHHKVLEIGSGSGYQLAVLSELAGKVTGVEINEKLAERSRKTLGQHENVEIVHGDGLEPVEEKFDRILYSAAIDEEEWNEAQNYLEEDGILIAPVKKNGRQVIHKLKNEEVTENTLVRFVEKV